MRRIALAASILAALVLAAFARDFAMPPLVPANRIAFHDAHPDEKLTLAADPYDTPQKAALFHPDMLGHAVLPILVVFTNDGDAPSCSTMLASSSSPATAPKPIPSRSTTSAAPSPPSAPRVPAPKTRSPSRSLAKTHRTAESPPRTRTSSSTPSSPPAPSRPTPPSRAFSSLTPPASTIPPTAPVSTSPASLSTKPTNSCTSKSRSRSHSPRGRQRRLRRSLSRYRYSPYPSKTLSSLVIFKSSCTRSLTLSSCSRLPARLVET